MQISLDGIARPVALDGNGELIGVVEKVLRGWRIRSAGPADGASPVITVTRIAGHYRRHSPWMRKDRAFRDPVDAVCDLVADLIQAYVADNPSLLCLHCAAVASGDGLVIFPSRFRAGKSTLAVGLAASGARLFSDDVLPLEGGSNHGVAPGIMPRLRLPLPDDAGRRFHEFVAERIGPRSQRYLYVSLRDTELAPRGTTAPIRGIVMLERTDKGETGFGAIDAGAALKEIILRNFARERPGLDILDRLHGVVAGARCRILRYRNAAEAVQLVQREFGCSGAERAAG